ncbi:hypothetical protein [Rhodococcus sp. 1168]|uniref:hypothetical protein n=1 Tax=Rhodococcus sp. 1168 TaxID=2018041 RepID=UPI000A0B9472|nr:hypothetical protein [Rhodococcus sp. 1168]ORI26018.1 hypothetical protein BJI47_01040 [Rhodococcus sp. 1168]
MLGKAEAEAERVRAEVIGLPTVQAETDGVTCLAAIETETVTSARLSTAGRLGRRKARAEHHAATEHARTTLAQVRNVWDGERPTPPRRYLHGQRGQQCDEPRQDPT